MIALVVGILLTQSVAGEIDDLLVRGFARGDCFDAAERAFEPLLADARAEVRGHAIARLLELNTILRPRLLRARELIRDHALEALGGSTLADRERIGAAIAWATEPRSDPLAAWRAIASHDPTDLVSGIASALRLRASGRLDEALGLLEELDARAPGNPVVVWFTADGARCALAPERGLAALSRLVATSPRLEDRIFAEGLAAEIESRDLRDPRAAALRVRRLEAAALAGQDCGDERVHSLVLWYEQSVRETDALAARRRSLAVAAAGAIAGFCGVVAIALALLSPRRRRIVPT